MNKITLLFILLLIFTQVHFDPAIAQSGTIEQMDFRNVQVDELSDNQIRSFIKRAESTGMSENELEAEAINRGMPYSEVLKLRQRINSLEEKDRSLQDTSASASEERYLTPAPRDSIIMEEEEMDSDIFGYDLFKRENLSFEPSTNIPTPENYILGPGDELIIEVWGASEQNYQQTVNPEGQIRFSNLGPVQVAGLSIEQATELIINKLSTMYSGLKEPNANTFAQVTLGKIRSIKVTIAGDAFNPGTYTLPSFSTVFNALYYAGGSAEIGSLRNIDVIRNNEKVAEVDLYDFLVKGEIVQNIRLKDEDLIFIHPVAKMVDVDGAVLRPATYEITDNETMQDLLEFAGGFASKAYTRQIKVQRITDWQRKILTVENDLFDSFLLKNGDNITVEEIIERLENRVTITGAVHREGEYGLEDSMYLTQLIEKAGGLEEDAFLKRIAIYRLDENNEIVIREADLEKIMQQSGSDILLQREDMVIISSRFDLRENQTIRIFGEVQQPGTFSFAENITLGEVIRKSGGFKESASLSKVEVARRLSDRNALAQQEKTTEVYTFKVDEDLLIDDDGAGFEIQPFDMIFVRRSPAYNPQKTIVIRGEVLFPGAYPITSRNERISDILERAGGFTDQAFLPGASLTRQQEFIGSQSEEQMQDLETDEFVIEQDTQNNTIGIDMEKILKNPYSIDDLILKEGDVLTIPTQLQTVRLTGGVLYPVSTIYQKNRSVRSYIARAGGYSDNAKKGKVFIVYPNGSVDRTRNYLLFKNYPKVEPGSEIIVPEKAETEGRTLQETIAISSSLTSLALVIVTIINRL